MKSRCGPLMDAAVPVCQVRIRRCECRHRLRDVARGRTRVYRGQYIEGDHIGNRHVLCQLHGTQVQCMSCAILQLLP
jgi:hypothetical protein